MDDSCSLILGWKVIHLINVNKSLVTWSFHSAGWCVKGNCMNVLFMHSKAHSRGTLEYLVDMKFADKEDGDESSDKI